MEPSGQRDVQAGGLRGLEGIYPLFFIAPLFAIEDIEGQQIFRRDLYGLCEQILLPAGVPLLPSREELLLNADKTILQLRCYCFTMTEGDVTGYLYSASLVLFVPVILLSAVRQNIESPTHNAIVWEETTPGLALKENLLPSVRNAAERFFNNFASDFAAAQSQAKKQMPNGDKAIVPEAKLTGYCLNADHPIGGPKARVFRAALGITADNADLLREKLLEAARVAEVTLRPATAYGQPYEIKFPMTGPNGNTLGVVSGWLIDTGGDIPRLTSCYVDID